MADALSLIASTLSLTVDLAVSATSLAVALALSATSLAVSFTVVVALCTAGMPAISRNLASIWAYRSLPALAPRT